MISAKEDFKRRIENEQKDNADKFRKIELYGIEMMIPCRDCMIEVYYYDRDVKEDLPVLFLMHGGGFALGHAGYEDALCCRLSQSLNSKVVCVNYRKTPRYPYPAAIHDVYDAILYFSSNAEKFGINTDNLLVMGNSAGANLAAVVSLMAKQLGEFKIKCQILGYPYLDCATPPKAKKYYEVDFSSDFMEVFNEYYAPPEQLKNVNISPVYASKEDLSGLPPAVIVLADVDALSEEGQSYANLLLEAGVEVHVKKVLGAQHGFIEHHFEGVLTPEEKLKYSKTFEEDAEKAIDFIVGTVKSVLEKDTNI
jgi:acetyl esterase